ncbi:MAG: tail fiber domain-containing protein, partial [Pyrinomonadaceae bacterium]|nr:tail fiber domain-containing protein [Pyrinomonadaceae bacterium]
VNATQLGGIAANQYVLTGDARLSDARSPLPGSGSYIQNAFSLQSGANFNISGTGTAAILNAEQRFNIGGESVLRAPSNNTAVGKNSGLNISTGQLNSFLGFQAGLRTSTGTGNSFFGQGAGVDNETGSNNSFFGVGAGDQMQSGNSNTMIGSRTRMSVDGLTNATAIGANATVGLSNSLVLGAINGFNGATSDTNVGIGTTSPTHRLQVNGNTFLLGNLGVGTSPTERLHVDANGSEMLVGGGGCPAGNIGIGLNGAFGSCANYTVRGDGQSVYINRPVGGFVFFREGNGGSQVLINPGGTLELRVLGASGGTALCRNASNLVSFCSSSLRYKKNIVSYAPGMSFIRQLRPIAYEWKTDGMKDVGFGAEDVAKIDPRFVTYNDKGEVEGIKYDRMSAAFVNAFREQETEISTQRAEIESLRKQVDQQKAHIAELKALICSVAGNAAACSVPK